MTDLGPVRRFLGLDAKNHGSGYALHQVTYIDTMLKIYGMQDAAEVGSPINHKINLEITKDNRDCPADHKEYLAIVGSLMYASLGGWPDITYVVALLSRFNIDPKTRHLTVAKRVFDISKEPNVYGWSTPLEISTATLMLIMRTARARNRLADTYSLSVELPFPGNQ